MPHRSDPILWFTSDPIPDLVSDPAIIVGGTSLLDEFFGFVSNHRGLSSLSIAVPFVGTGFVANSPQLWESMDHPSIDLRVVVRRQVDAEIAVEQLEQFPWRSMQIGVTPRLHAKMYAFNTAEFTGASLVGSHNLSRQGITANFEAGVLMLSRRPGALRTVRDIHDDICTRLLSSRLILDTTSHAALLSRTRN